MPNQRKPTVLVVGGGFGGRSALRYFIDTLKDTNIVLVDEKPYFEFTPSVLRCVVDPDHLKRITFEQGSDPKVSFMQGNLAHITNTEATVISTGEDEPSSRSVPFDFCVWATGVQFSRPISCPAWQKSPCLIQRREDFSYFRYRVLAAKE